MTDLSRRPLALLIALCLALLIAISARLHGQGGNNQGVFTVRRADASVMWLSIPAHDRDKPPVRVDLYKTLPDTFLICGELDGVKDIGCLPLGTFRKVLRASLKGGE